MVRMCTKQYSVSAITELEEILFFCSLDSLYPKKQAPNTIQDYIALK